MSISLSVSIAYNRRRPDTTDRVEQRIDAWGLLVVGGLIALALIWIILPRFLDWLAKLP